MTKKVLNGLFVGVILLLLSAGLVSTLLFPDEINAYENRYAEQVDAFTAGGFLDGSFQDSMDKALADQVNFSQYYKKIYNKASSALLEWLARPVLDANPDRYINYMGLRIFGGDYITYWTRSLSSMTAALDEKADNYNQTAAAYPDTDFFLYYIEKDTDINFETGEKVLAYDYLVERLTLPQTHTACFRIDSFEDFRARFYRTDHHWSYLGSYQAYTEVLDLLQVGDAPLTPLETVSIGSFRGSKATSAATMTESFDAYRFAFPAMDITINGAAAEDYGNQDGFLNGELSGVSYGGFYGGDMGEIIFDTGSEGRGNLLVIGESYDNAILKLLASHFDRTYSIDLRYYTAYMGEEFQLGAYLEEHDIHQVLLIGNVDYFIMSEFLLEN